MAKIRKGAWIIFATHSVWIIATAVGVTVFLRFLPFLIFRKGKKTPPLITRMGKVLPYAIMGMLVVYCLKGASVTAAPFGVPKANACLTVILLHIRKPNTLLSVGLGTLCYMVLIQTIF